jgi:hypothetical protein
MRHTPHEPEEGVRSSMDDAEDMMPGVYEHPETFPSGWGRAIDRESSVPVQRAKGKPDHPVTIYRALPSDQSVVNPGNWVSPSATYARKHGESNLGHTGWHVIKATIPARHLHSEGNSVHEWGYQGADDIQGTRHAGPFEKQQREATVAKRQQEGDERAFGDYAMRYRTDDLGERKPRHIIEARTPDGSRVGELNWYGTTGTVHHIGVAGPEDEPGGNWGDGQDHRRKGLATAMWDWSQEMTPKAKHSGDQTTQGKDWVRGLEKPRKDPPAGHEVVAHFEAVGAEYGPKPEWQRGPEGASDEEQSAHFYRQDKVKHDWEDHVTHGISTGQLTPARAKELGYYFDGHQTDERGDPKWKPLPQHLYHVTTDLPGVRAHGLKSRRELEQQHGGHGLGGGPDDMISMTDSHGTAKDILRAVHEFHHVVNGRYTPAQMWEDAKAGRGAPRPFHEDLASYWRSGWKDGDELPRGLDSAIREKQVKAGGLVHTPQEMAEREGPGWTPHYDTSELRGGDGQTRYNVWERDHDPDSRREHAADFYKNFAAYREYAGGHMNPTFFSTDTKAFAAKDPKDFAIVHARPRPGAMGYPVSALGEWRTGTGDALETHRAERLEDGHLKEASVRRFAALENPHTHGQEWYHGSPHSFGEFGDGNNSPLEYEDDPEDTSHWNALLGNHFAGSHGMAEEFSKGEHGGDGHGDGEDGGPAQNVVHARLELKNPKVYASEHDMDQDAYEHEFRAGNHHEAHHDPEVLAEAREEGYEDELPPTYQYAGHSDRMRGKDERDEAYWHQNRQFHPYATGWLNSHPGKYDIAQRFRQRLQDAGHDGIVYGNEFEKHHGTADSHHVCAIPFRAHQVDVTQRHSGGDCMDQHSAVRQWPGRSQPMLPGMGGHEGSLEVVAHFDEPKTAMPLHMQQKLFDTPHSEPDDPDWTPASPAGWRYNHETFGVVQSRGPRGQRDSIYTDETGLHSHRHPEDLHGPLYHGSSREFQPGEQIEAGHPGNFTDEPLDHAYMTEQAEGDDSYKGARGYGRHVYEVKPTGWYGHRSDARGIEWATQDPLHVVREVVNQRGHTAAMTGGPDQVSASEERGDRWHEFQNRYNDDLHRGIHVELPGALHGYVHDENEPREERARALADHFSGSGLGMHWTPHPNIASRSIHNALSEDDNESAHDPDDEYGYDPDNRKTFVMLHVKRPGERNRLRDPQELSRHEIGRGFSQDEDEFPLKPGSPLRLSGISWKEHDPDYPLEPFEHVDFPKPVRHVSSVTHAVREDNSLHLPDGSALVEGRECPGCGQHVTRYKGTWWNGDDTPHDCDDFNDDSGHTAAVVAHFEDDDDNENPDYYPDDGDREDETPEYEEDEPEEEPVARRSYRLPYMSQPPEGELREHLHHHHGLDSRTSDLYMSPKNQVRWHDQEHRYKTNSTHQHDHPQGNPGEEHWPAVFRPSEHTDFPGGTRGDWSRVPGHTAPFKPLRTSESVHLPEVVAHFDDDEDSGEELRDDGLRTPSEHGVDEASHREPEMILAPVCDSVAAVTGYSPLAAVTEAAAALGAWEPLSQADAVAGAAALGDVFAALHGGLLRVATAIEEMPVDPEVADLVHGMARTALTAAQDAGRLVSRLPTEASCEEPGHRPNR